MELFVRKEDELLTSYRLNLPPCPGAYLVTETGDPVAECLDSGEWKAIVTIEEGASDAAEES